MSTRKSWTLVNVEIARVLTLRKRVYVVVSLAVSRNKLVDHHPTLQLLLQQVALVQEHCKVHEDLAVLC